MSRCEGMRYIVQTLKINEDMCCLLCVYFCFAECLLGCGGARCECMGFAPARECARHPRDVGLFFVVSLFVFGHVKA